MRALSSVTSYAPPCYCTNPPSVCPAVSLSVSLCHFCHFTPCWRRLRAACCCTSDGLKCQMGFSVDQNCERTQSVLCLELWVVSLWRKGISLQTFSQKSAAFSIFHEWRVTQGTSTGPRLLGHYRWFLFMCVLVYVHVFFFFLFRVCQWKCMEDTNWKWKPFRHAAGTKSCIFILATGSRPRLSVWC